jgi:hypothetical protein
MMGSVMNIAATMSMNIPRIRYRITIPTMMTAGSTGSEMIHVDSVVGRRVIDKKWLKMKAPITIRKTRRMRALELAEGEERETNHFCRSTQSSTSVCIVVAEEYLHPVASGLAISNLRNRIPGSIMKKGRLGHCSAPR